MNLYLKLSFFMINGLALLSLTGCVGLSVNRYLENKHDYMVKRGDPAPYAEGYVDGCSSGRRAGGDRRFKYRQHPARFEKDALYARGFQEGEIQCHNEMMANGLPIHEKPTQTAPLTEEQQKLEAEMRELWEDLRK